MSMIRCLLWSGTVAMLAGCGTVAPFETPPDPATVRALLAAGSGSNVAATAADAKDDRLHARRDPRDLAATRQRVSDAIGRLPRWNLAGHSDSVLWATRTTRLWRFTDDVLILLVPDGDSTRIEARSASRVGKSDLGQNRRNLAELWAALAGPSG